MNSLLKRPGACVWPLWLVIVAYNNLTSLFPKETHDKFYVPANIAFLVLMLLWACRGLKLSLAQLGLRGRPWRSLAWGVVLGVLVPSPVFVLVAYPRIVGETVEDPRVAQSAGELLFIVLVRIPLATALFEEVLFRGILLVPTLSGLRFTTSWRAAVVSSAGFGLWHIAVTVRNFRDSGAFESWAFAGGLLGAVLGTFVGGLLFCWMRYRTGHIAGSTAAHWLINSLSSVAGYWREQRL